MSQSTPHGKNSQVGQHAVKAAHELYSPIHQPAIIRSPIYNQRNLVAEATSSVNGGSKLLSNADRQSSTGQLSLTCKKPTTYKNNIERNPSEPRIRPSLQPQSALDKRPMSSTQGGASATRSQTAQRQRPKTASTVQCYGARHTSQRASARKDARNSDMITQKSQISLKTDCRKSILAKNKSNSFGIPGYPVMRSGAVPQQYPKYTIQKDEKQNYLNQVMKHAQAVPGAPHYYKPLSWKTQNGQFSKGADRKTFTDEAVKQSKKVPAITDYDPVIEKRILLGFSCKEEDVSYLTDSEFVGKTLPGPGNYKQNYELVEEKPMYTKIIAPPEKKSWRPVKTKGPDVGSYEAATALDKTKKRQQVNSFCGNLDGPSDPRTKPKPNFASQAIKQKKFVPGTGSYRYEQCYNNIAIPYMKKRC